MTVFVTCHCSAAQMVFIAAFFVLFWFFCVIVFKMSTVTRLPIHSDTLNETNSTSHMQTLAVRWSHEQSDIPQDVKIKPIKIVKNCTFFFQVVIDCIDRTKVSRSTYREIFTDLKS